MVAPARVGDVLVSLTWKKMQGRILAWSIFHRISEGLTTIALSFFVLGIFFHSRYEQAQWVGGIIFFAVILAGIFLVLNERAGRRFFQILKKILNLFQQIPLASKILSFEENLKQQFEIFYQTMAKFQSRHTLSLLILITLSGRVLIVLVNMMLLRALGVDLPALNVLGILAATWVGSFLSPTPSGIGVGDLAPSFMLSHYGYQESAGAYIILNRFIDFSLISFWSMMFASTSRKSLTVTAG